MAGGCPAIGPALTGTTRPDPSTAEVAPYFDSVYGRLAASPAFAAMGREVYGDAFAWQIGYAGDRELLRLIEIAGIRPDGRVLDLCAGAGGLSARMEALAGCRAVAFDAATPSLGQSAVIGAAEALPIRDASFDAIVSVDGFTYAPGAMLSECCRVLKPGGRSAFLLSIQVGAIGRFTADLESAGMREVLTERATEGAVDLLGRLEAGYRTHRAALEAEVGRSLYQGLSREVRSLLRAMRSGAIERLYVFGER